MLSGRRVLAQFEDYNLFDQLNHEAFPPEEFLETEKIISLAQQGLFEVTALYDGEEFVGFFVVVAEKTVVYLFFLAIDEAKRSRGYGAQALRLLKDMYPGCQIALDMEEVDETAGNYEQRKRRLRFYSHNGYVQTGFFLDYNGIVLEVLCDSENFDYETFSNMLKKIRVTEQPLFLFRKDCE